MTQPIDYNVIIEAFPDFTDLSKEDQIKRLDSWMDNFISQLNDLMFTHGYAINASVMGLADIIQLQPAITAPLSPSDGWIAFANGTSWNPGAGKGLYVYKSGAWNFIA